MLKALFLFFLVCHSPLSAFGQSDLTDDFREFSNETRSVGRPPGDSSCHGTCDSIFPTSTLHSPATKKNIELSVVTHEKAQEIFRVLKNDEDNAFNFSLEGCYARSHKMALMMDDMGVISGKIFIEGSFPFKDKDFEAIWAHHTANVILVKKQGKIRPMIIDPAFFDKPVSVDEWKKRIMKDPKAKLEREFFAKRYHFDRLTFNQDLTDYNQEDLKKMKADLKTYSRIGYLIEEKPAPKPLKDKKK